MTPISRVIRSKGILDIMKAFTEAYSVSSLIMGVEGPQHRDFTVRSL